MTACGSTDVFPFQPSLGELPQQLLETVDADPPVQSDTAQTCSDNNNNAPKIDIESDVRALDADRAQSASPVTPDPDDKGGMGETESLKETDTGTQPPNINITDNSGEGIRDKLEQTEIEVSVVPKNEPLPDNKEAITGLSSVASTPIIERRATRGKAPVDYKALLAGPSITRKLVPPKKPAFDEKGQRVYCVCRRPDSGKFMIQCDNCEEWYVVHTRARYHFQFLMPLALIIGSMGRAWVLPKKSGRS